MIRSIISGTGSYAPSNVVTNYDLARFVDTSDEWIFSRTGIRTRRLVGFEGKIATVEMAEHASHGALRAAKISPEELDMIIVGTVTPDYRVPSAACVLQYKLGAKNACAFDINAACAGSLYGLSIADKFIRTGTYQKILVVGVETMSSVMDWKDRNTCVLFGDAAGAVVMEATLEDKGFIDFELFADGSHYNDIVIPAKDPTRGQEYARMNGRETYKFATRALAQSAEQILRKNNFTVSDVKHVVAHQANLRIIETVADLLDMPLEKFVLNIEKYANTSSASLLTTFDEATKECRLKSGDLTLMLAIGGGFAYGAGLYQR